MTIDLDKLEALAKAATPGPWLFNDRESADWFMPIVSESVKELICGESFRRDEDGAYLAALDPATVLDLIRLISDYHAALDGVLLLVAIHDANRERQTKSEFLDRGYAAIGQGMKLGLTTTLTHAERVRSKEKPPERP